VGATDPLATTWDDLQERDPDDRPLLVGQAMQHNRCLLMLLSTTGGLAAHDAESAASQREATLSSSSVPWPCARALPRYPSGLDENELAVEKDENQP
jgi:hypothetical protein